MLLKIIDDGVEIPYVIDSGKDDGVLWVQVWRGKKCLCHLQSFDDAMDCIFGLLKRDRD